MGDSPTLEGVVPIDRSNLTLTDRVETHLREQIVQGMHAPGARLNEGDIARSFG
jgi:DNA-binding GntR family transcriptional regulator